MRWCVGCRWDECACMCMCPAASCPLLFRMEEEMPCFSEVAMSFPWFHFCTAVICDIQPGRHGLLRSSIRIWCARIYANAVERRIVLYFIGLSVFVETSVFVRDCLFSMCMLMTLPLLELIFLQLRVLNSLMTVYWHELIFLCRL